MNYGYARVSTKKQNLQRQLDNIHSACPEAKIYAEAYTGKTMARPRWESLKKLLKQGDVVYFDSVSRMSRNAEEGAKEFFELVDRGVSLVFLNEQHINSDEYKRAASQSIDATGDAVADLFIDAVNRAFRLLAERQIVIAFEQSQKERDDLSKRTKAGLAVARNNGKELGQKQGKKLTVKKAATAKETILMHNADFGGTLTDKETIALCGIARGTYYRYKKELRENPILEEGERKK